MPGVAPPSKPCARCGRTITWRRKWARDWEAVRWCSDACRRAGVSSTDTHLEHHVLQALAALPRGGTLALASLPSPDATALRAAACRLVANGEAVLLVGGRVERDPSRVRGDLILRLP